MRSGTVSMLRKGLATLGLIGEWDPERAVGNPVLSIMVKQYQLIYVKRRTSKGGSILMREDMVKLLQRKSAYACS